MAVANGPIKVALVRWERLVAAKFLSFPEDRRGLGLLAEDGDYRLYSGRRPEIRYDSLYAPGTVVGDEGQVMARTFLDESVAREFIETVIRMVRKANKAHGVVAERAGGGPEITVVE